MSPLLDTIAAATWARHEADLTHRASGGRVAGFLFHVPFGQTKQTMFHFPCGRI